MLPARYIESNTGGVQDRIILPKGVKDFPILYFFQDTKQQFRSSMCHGHFNFHFVRFETEWPECSFEKELMFKLNVPPFMVEPEKIE